MKFRSTKVVEAEQWFPGKDVPGVFFYQPPPARLSDRQGGFSEFPQLPYYAIRQDDGKIFRVDPGDWVIADRGGETHRTVPDDIFTSCYAPHVDGPPPPSASEQFLLDFFQLTSRHNLTDGWGWRVDGGKAVIYADCSCVFARGNVDCERVTPENFAQLKQTFEDCKRWRIWAVALFCARVRQRRPRRGFYVNMPSVVVDLFNACAPS